MLPPSLWSLCECIKSPRQRSASVPVSRTISGSTVDRKTTMCSVTSEEIDGLQVKKKYRVAVMGATQAGKTAIVQRFLGMDFDDRYFPTIETYHRKSYKVKDCVYQLEIVDTSGNQPFPASRKLSYMSGSIVGTSDMFLLVGTVENAESIYHLHEIKKAIIEEKTSRDSRLTREPPIVYLINKTDLPKYRWNVEGEDEIFEVLNRTLGSVDDVFLTSALTSSNIDKALAKLFALRGCPRFMNPEVNTAAKAEEGGDQKKSVMRRFRELFQDPPADVVVQLNTRRPSIRGDFLAGRHKFSAASQIQQLSDRSVRSRSEGRKKCKVM